MRKIAISIAVAAAAIYLWNASWIAGAPDDPQIRLIAHRGVHQTFSREGLTSETCTAARIFPPEHAFIENTIPSMRAAFDAGADVVELDVHPTTDGQFAVIHDWTVDCRTEGEGVTRQHDMATLKTLDVGYGYTADGGQTFPLRGTGAGMIPTLTEVFEAFPESKFLVNYKSNRMQEGEELVALLTEHPEWRANVFGVYGGSAPTNRVRRADLGIPGYDRQSLLDCLLPYRGLGWSGYVPEACHDGIVAVPQNLGWLLWGWPHRFTERMKSVGTEVFIVGPFEGNFTVGIDDAAALSAVPQNFDGYIWTNRIEVIGPLVAAR